MTTPIQMILSYKIQPSCQKAYELVMKEIIDSMPVFGIDNIEWISLQPDGLQYTETYIVPTEAHYFALKKMRQTKTHAIFGLLDSCIDGGLDSIECYAIKFNLSKWCNTKQSLKVS